MSVQQKTTTHQAPTPLISEHIRLTESSFGEFRIAEVPERYYIVCIQLEIRSENQGREFKATRNNIERHFMFITRMRIYMQQKIQNMSLKSKKYVPKTCVLKLRNMLHICCKKPKKYAGT